MLVIEQEKNRDKNPVKAFIPLIAPLQTVIEKSRSKGVLGDLYFIAQPDGRPYVKESCQDAGLGHCSMHGLRKACVVRMIEEDCTPFEIMAVTGHRTMKEIERYGRDYLRERAAESVFDKRLARHAASVSEAEAHVGALLTTA